MSQARLNQMARRVLRSMFRLGLFDFPRQGSPTADVTTPAHAQLARSIAEQGAVLLQNTNNALPLNQSTLGSIALLGPGAQGPMIGGRGSGNTVPPYISTPVRAFQQRLGTSAAVNYLHCEFGRVCEAEHATLAAGAEVHARWSGYDGYNFVAGLGKAGATLTWTVDNVPGPVSLTADCS